MTGFERLFVIYRTSDERFAKAYERLKESFPNAIFLQQERKKDFQPLVLKALFHSPSQYILFGVDDIVVKDFVDLQFCMQTLHKTDAYGFYLRFGKNICRLFQTGERQEVPESVALPNGVFAWDVKRGAGDWGFPNSLDMTLFRKKDLKKAFEKMRFKTPNSLESIWAKEYAPDHAIGLYFEQSKIVNLPLNVVGRSGTRHTNFASLEELLVQFEEGYKIDLAPLYKIENDSPHFDYTPTLILR